MVDVTGITLSPKTSTAEAGEPGNRQLTATVMPEDATNKDMSFEIDNAVGLSVSGTGRIEWTENTPSGQYTTKVTTEDGGFTDTHVLTLTEPEIEEGD